MAHIAHNLYIITAKQTVMLCDTPRPRNNLYAWRIVFHFTSLPGRTKLRSVSDKKSHLGISFISVHVRCVRSIIKVNWIISIISLSFSCSTHEGLQYILRVLPSENILHNKSIQSMCLLFLFLYNYIIILCNEDRRYFKSTARAGVDSEQTIRIHGICGPAVP